MIKILNMNRKLNYIVHSLILQIPHIWLQHLVTLLLLQISADVYRQAAISAQGEVQGTPTFSLLSVPSSSTVFDEAFGDRSRNVWELYLSAVFSLH